MFNDEEIKNPNEPQSNDEHLFENSDSETILKGGENLGSKK